MTVTRTFTDEEQAVVTSALLDLRDTIWRRNTSLAVTSGTFVLPATARHQLDVIDGILRDGWNTDDPLSRIDPAIAPHEECRLDSCDCACVTCVEARR